MGCCKVEGFKVPCRTARQWKVVKSYKTCCFAASGDLILRKNINKENFLIFAVVLCLVIYKLCYHIVEVINLTSRFCLLSGRTPWVNSHVAVSPPSPLPPPLLPPPRPSRLSVTNIHPQPPARCGCSGSSPAGPAICGGVEHAHFTMSETPQGWPGPERLRYCEEQRAALPGTGVMFFDTAFKKKRLLHLYVGRTSVKSLHR